MQTIYEASLSAILPEALAADKQFVAIAKALDPLLKKFAADARLAMHLPRLDELTGTILDVLAEQFHVDNFDALTLSDTQKRNLIRQSIAHHRQKGTPAAVEHVANQFFRNAQVIDDLGDFLFKIKTNEYTASHDAFDTFCRMLFDAKNVRSWLTGIDMDYSPPKAQVFVGNPLATSGSVRVDLPRPKSSRANIQAGNLFLTTGHLTSGLMRPRPSKVNVRVGCPLLTIGQILIDSKERPVLQAVHENPTADLAIANVMIARGDNFVEPTRYDWLKIFFTSPYHNWERFVKIPHPRDDLTRSQIKKVADYAIEHNLLTHRFAPVGNAPNAHLIQVRVTNLI